MDWLREGDRNKNRDERTRIPRQPLTILRPSPVEGRMPRTEDIFTDTRGDSTSTKTNMHETLLVHGPQKRDPKGCQIELLAQALFVLVSLLVPC